MVIKIFKILEFITILFAIFGVFVLFVSLFLFAKISKNLVKKFLEENDTIPLEEQTD